MSASGASAPAVGSGREAYLAEVWNTDRGLPNVLAMSVVQTRDGFLWVATFDGVARFDGLRFQVFNTANTPGLKNDFVEHLYEDSRGRLWAATFAGPVWLEAGTWHSVGFAAGRAPGNVRRFAEDSSGQLLALAGPTVYLEKDGILTPLPATKGMQVRSLQDDASHNIFLQAGQSVARLAGGRLIPLPLSPAVRASEILALGAARGGGVWVVSAGAAVQYRQERSIRQISFPPGIRPAGVTSVLEDSAGNLWVGMRRSGLVQLRRDGACLTFGKGEGLPSAEVRSIAEDREQNIWVGTDGGGLVRLRRRLADVYDIRHGLRHEVINTVQEVSPGRLLVSTYGGGLSGFDARQQRFTPAAGRASSALQPDSRVLAAYRDRGGVLWVSSGEGNLLRITAAGVSPVPAAAVPPGAARAFFEDSRGNLWIGSTRLLVRFDGREFRRFGSEEGLPSGSVYAIAEDPTGGLWVCSPAGLVRLSDGRFQAAGPPQWGPKARPSSLYVDRAGAVWTAAPGAGLARWKAGAWTYWGMDQGFLVRKAAAIIEDDQGRLWFATDSQGVASVPRASLDAVAAGRAAQLETRWITRQDGLSSNNTRVGFQPNAWRAGDGRLWFSTLSGLVSIDPAQILQHAFVPPVWIETGAGSGTLAPFGPESTATLSFAPRTRRIEFAFRAPSFAAPDQTRFLYRLEGVDASWLETAGSTVSFADLPPGSYLLEVKAVHSGLTSPVPARVSFLIEPRLWETLWFQFFAGSVLLAAAAALGYAIQRRKVRQRTALFERERELRLNLEQVQTVLRASEERFSKAFYSVPFPMVISTLEEGLLLDVNAGFVRVSGYQREELLGKPSLSLGLWEDPSQRAHVVATLLAGGKVREFEVYLRTKAGDLRPQLLTAEQIDLAGQPALLTVLDDLTERRQIEAQFRQAQKMESIGLLAGGIAHDFNNLLTVINGFGDLVLRELPTGGREYERVRQMLAAGERAADLTRQLLAFGRKQVIEPRPLKLGQLVAESRKMLGSLIRADIQIVTLLDPAERPVFADPGQVQQVIMNLAINARDAMPHGGSLTFETANVDFDSAAAATHPGASPGAYVRLSVADTGEGMSLSVQERIFDPFFTTKPAGAGTGLGLASVYGIVRQSHGWIAFSSEPGRGTRFDVFLPCAGAGAGAAPATDRSANPDGAGGTETVLIADDHNEVRALAADALRGYGYHVLEAAGGAEALRLLSTSGRAVDLLISDIVMPGMGGRELASRALLLRPGLRVLFVSGYADDPRAPDDPTGPRHVMLVKPFTPNGLARRVREVLDAPPASSA